ncbi:hypothetical protein KDA82_18955 [Streptomyces daliensis]|uniref:Secreted protein n=1 Tax=Streptomyces daliensis TaxID=299421 RepID=A0A8T4J0J0_9ACTN|nr:hypothetical protein [Streptomyces daliensis]
MVVVVASRASRTSSYTQRALLRAGLVAAAAGAALGAGGAATASADSPSAAPASSGDSGATGEEESSLSAAVGGLGEAGVQGVRGAHEGLGGAIGAVKRLQLDPLANTGSDPLDNGVVTQVADFRPISTRTVTGPITRGDSLSELPLVGPVTKVLPG